MRRQRRRPRRPRRPRRRGLRRRRRRRRVRRRRRRRACRGIRRATRTMRVTTARYPQRSTRRSASRYTCARTARGRRCSFYRIRPLPRRVLTRVSLSRSTCGCGHARPRARRRPGAPPGARRRWCSRAPGGGVATCAAPAPLQVCAQRRLVAQGLSTARFPLSHRRPSASARRARGLARNAPPPPPAVQGADLLEGPLDGYTDCDEQTRICTLTRKCRERCARRKACTQVTRARRAVAPPQRPFCLSPSEPTLNRLLCAHREPCALRRRARTTRRTLPGTASSRASAPMRRWRPGRE